MTRNRKDETGALLKVVGIMSAIFISILIYLAVSMLFRAGEILNCHARYESPAAISICIGER